MIKRVFDIVAAALLLVLFSPLMLMIAIVVWLTMGRPVLFRQERPGKDCVPFTLLKFRTMRDAVGEHGKALPDSERLTRVGRFLRATSLDELPQLINVLRGDMSFVGPRPLLMRYLPYYTPREALRHKVRPGITGWAQVNGRNELAWDKRLEMDVWYAEHQSFWLDIKILLMTVRNVIARRGVVVDTSRMVDLDVERANRGQL